MFPEVPRYSARGAAGSSARLAGLQGWATLGEGTRSVLGNKVRDGFLGEEATELGSGKEEPGVATGREWG